jgi:hypothetical protein
VVTTCSGEPGAVAGPRWHAGAAYGMFFSRLSFFGGPSIGMERRAVTAGFEYRFSPEVTLGLSAGAGIGGLITEGTTRHDVRPGWLVAGSYSRRILDGRGPGPFLLFSASLGASGASTREEVRPPATGPTAGLYAFDIRAGLTVGKTFWNVLSPYTALRAFGGPVIWGHAGKTVVGGDLYHFQGALGLVSALGRGFDLYAEGVPLGERGLTVGGGKSF